MRFRFLAALLVLLPAPALADVTAHYIVQDKPVTIEIEDGGNARMTLADKVTLIRRDGIDYLVTKDATGATRVVRGQDLLAVFQAQMKSRSHPPPPASGMTSCWPKVPPRRSRAIPARCGS